VWDASDARLAAAQKFLRGVAVTKNSAEITDATDIDAVVVATPTSTHFALVKAALSAGKDVLCEKPLAPTAAECAELAALALAKGRVLMVGHVFLYNSGVLHLKTDLDRGELGRIYYMDAVRTNLGPVRSDVGASGVMFSIDTDSGFPRAAVISAAWGLGETVVQGSVDPDKYLVIKPLLAEPSFVPIITKILGYKARKMVYRQGGKYRAVAWRVRAARFAVLDGLPAVRCRFRTTGAGVGISQRTRVSRNEPPLRHSDQHNACVRDR